MKRHIRRRQVKELRTLKTVLKKGLLSVYPASMYLFGVFYGLSACWLPSTTDQRPWLTSSLPLFSFSVLFNSLSLTVGCYWQGVTFRGALTPHADVRSGPAAGRFTCLSAYVKATRCVYLRASTRVYSSRASRFTEARRGKPGSRLTT